jgi:hypothetical protein
MSLIGMGVQSIGLAGRTAAGDNLGLSSQEFENKHPTPEGPIGQRQGMTAHATPSEKVSMFRHVRDGRPSPRRPGTRVAPDAKSALGGAAARHRGHKKKTTSLAALRSATSLSPAYLAANHVIPQRRAVPHQVELPFLVRAGNEVPQLPMRDGGGPGERAVVRDKRGRRGTARAGRPPGGRGRGAPGAGGSHWEARRALGEESGGVCAAPLGRPLTGTRDLGMRGSQG